MSGPVDEGCYCHEGVVCPACERQAASDRKRLVRELDVALNGEAGAAAQASLCDLVAQVKSEARRRGVPLLASRVATPTPACTCPSGDGSLRWPCPAHPPVTSGQSSEAPTLLIDVRGEWFDVPIPVHLHVIALREQLASDVSGQPFIRNLLAHTEHCLSAADEGEAYAASRETLDAMTTMGLMTKVGRGRWAPTEAAEKFVQAARSSTAPPATSGLDRAAIRMLVAAGFVTEAKANEALSIAHGFAAGPLESVASDQIGEDCGCRQGRGAGGPMIPYTCEEHRAPATSALVEAVHSVIGNLNNATAIMRDRCTEAGPNRAWLTQQVDLLRAGLRDAALAAHDTGRNGQ